MKHEANFNVNFNVYCMLAYFNRGLLAGWVRAGF